MTARGPLIENLLVAAAAMVWILAGKGIDPGVVVVVGEPAGPKGKYAPFPRREKRKRCENLASRRRWGVPNSG